MRRATGSLLTTALLFLASPRGEAQFFTEECSELPASVEERLAGLTRICGTNAQQSAHSARSMGFTLWVDEQKALRAMAGNGEPVAAATIEGPVSNAGSVDDTIFWGTWVSGVVTWYEGDREVSSHRASALPYAAGRTPGTFFREDVIAGRARTPMPTTGTVGYRLLGRPAISSSNDTDGNAVALGSIEDATVRVDFDADTAVAEFTFFVRGLSTRTRIQLRRLDRPSDRFVAADCGDALARVCPDAELEFYGRQGEFVGLHVSTLHYNAAMDESARVARKLQNVRGATAIALRKY
jgi:hypothetical protein